MDPRIEQAMWDGDINRLDQLAGCVCCCHEHTMGPSCPAWQWAGCRGWTASGKTEAQEEREWFAHYKRFHEMTEDQFYGAV